MKLPFSIHTCLLDKECKDVGAPPRLYISAFGWGVIIALGRDGRTQSWSPRHGYGRTWRWVVLTPPSQLLCVRNGGPPGCGRLRNHRGNHVGFIWNKGTDQSPTPIRTEDDF